MLRRPPSRLARLAKRYLTTKTLCTLLIVVFLSTSALAETAHDARLWLNFTAEGSWSEGSKWRWHFDIQQRNRDGGVEADQFVVRPGVGYALNANSNVWIGYAYTLNFTSSGTAAENRLWEQHLWSKDSRGGALTLRTRLEQRWFENVQETAWRIREQVKFVGRVSQKSHVAPIAWDEIMFHLNATERSLRGFDQNRAFAGVGLRVNSKSRIELGYMNQFRRNVDSNQMNHVLSTVFNVSF